MTIGQIMEIVEENGFNVTFTGGDPMYQPRAIAELADHLHAKGYSIWCYTGFTFGQLMDDAEMQEALRRCDVIVDGPFQLSERDTSLRFRGSSNQRLIDVAKSIATGNISLWND
jgi:Organic radical activating enzymes